MNQHLENIIIHKKRGGWRGVVFWLSKQIHRTLVPELEGDHVFDSDWDLLIILDGCRPEWLAQEWSQQQFSGDVETRLSIGSHSHEWMDKTFSENYRSDLSQTAYISANYHTSIPPEDEFYEFRPLKEEYFNDEIMTIPAHYVTNHTIDVGRELDPNRTIAHYLQPHVPFVDKGDSRYDYSLRDIWKETDGNPFDAYMREEMSKQTLVNEYQTNLRYVLDEVKLLLENFDAEKVVVTADHGNALGERYIFQHPNRVRSKHVRRVPWVETRAVDKGTLSDVDTEPPESSDINKEEQLKALGYR